MFALFPRNSFTRGPYRMNAVHSSWFTHFARTTARASGKPIAFGLAFAVVAIWAATGPIFGFSDTWQLVINTSTTIVTFLMVFLIQNSQNRDAEAVQLKLGELIRAVEGAQNAFVDLDDLEDDELDRLHMKYAALAVAAREKARRGGSDGVVDPR
jgi:low affinity Fe/Cu permease